MPRIDVKNKKTLAFLDKVKNENDDVGNRAKAVDWICTEVEKKSKEELPGDDEELPGYLQMKEETEELSKKCQSLTDEIKREATKRIAAANKAEASHKHVEEAYEKIDLLEKQIEEMTSAGEDLVSEITPELQNIRKKNMEQGQMVDQLVGELTQTRQQLQSTQQQLASLGSVQQIHSQAQRAEAELAGMKTRLTRGKKAFGLLMGAQSPLDLTSKDVIRGHLQPIFQG